MSSESARGRVHHPTRIWGRTYSGWLRGVVAVAILTPLLKYVLDLLHEGMHQVVAVLQGGGPVACQADGVPIAWNWTAWGLPHLYTCFQSPSMGVNLVAATTGTSLLGLLVAYYSGGLAPWWLRWAVLLAGLKAWLGYGLYASGLLEYPIRHHGHLVLTGGDGARILHAFGRLGQLPGYLVLGLGLIVVYERLRDSPVMCSACQPPRRRRS